MYYLNNLAQLYDNAVARRPVVRSLFERLDVLEVMTWYCPSTFERSFVM